MLSVFIAQHPDVDVFKLDEDEWREAVRSKPELLATDEMMRYFPRSANAWIEPKKDNYFDNEHRLGSEIPLRVESD